ncbi:hypothetical protein BDZ91DRAFT_731004 [Kalaharituber pfeilii]|nr:hypothetical protein BDZ91DRAFT_731004 [Kalaharituber pfeilii]
MSDDSSNQRKRKRKWHTSYFTMSIPEAKKRLGIRINEIKPIPIQRALAGQTYNFEGVEVIKDMVYERILEFVDVESKGIRTSRIRTLREGISVIWCTVSSVP